MTALPCKDYGFILKRLSPPYSEYVSLISLSLGKTRMTLNEEKIKRKLSSGMLIELNSFFSQEKKRIRQMQQDASFIIDYIYYTSPEEMIQLHQLCELGYYFIPSEDPSAEYFNFFLHYYRFWRIHKNAATIFSLEQKKRLHICFVIYLLFICGFTGPQDIAAFYDLQKVLIHLPEKEEISIWLKEIHFFLNEISSLSYDNAVTWIKITIREHSCYQSFKSIQ